MNRQYSQLTITTEATMKHLRRLLKTFAGLLLTLLLTLSTSATAATSTLRQIGSFNAIEAGGLVNVELQHGDENQMHIRASGISLDDIITRIEGDTLLITTRGRHSGEDIRVTLTYKVLQQVKTSGTATISTLQPITAGNLAVNITQNGDANLELNVGTLNVNMRDNGNLTLHGRAQTMSLVSSGGGGRLNNAKLKIGNDRHAKSEAAR